MYICVNSRLLIASYYYIFHAFFHAIVLYSFLRYLIILIGLLEITGHYVQLTLFVRDTRTVRRAKKTLLSADNVINVIILYVCCFLNINIIFIVRVQTLWEGNVLVKNQNISQNAGFAYGGPATPATGRLTPRRTSPDRLVSPTRIRWSLPFAARTRSHHGRVSVRCCLSAARNVGVFYF